MLLPKGNKCIELAKMCVEQIHREDHLKQDGLQDRQHSCRRHKES